MSDSATVIDLFCGAGGLSLGAARAGFTLVGAVDNDPQAIKSHSVNFPHCKHWLTDISHLGGKELLRCFDLSGRKLDGLIGGPPCQGFSCIGHNNSSDSRNRLFISFFRIVNECRPKFFLSENVPGILSEKHKETLDLALSCAEDYVVLSPLRLTASDYGAPTSRTRIFFFGYLKDFFKQVKPEDFKPPQDVEKVCVQEALKGLPKRINPSWQREEQGWRKLRVAVNGEFGKRLYGFVPKSVGDKESIRILEEERKVSGCLGTLHSSEVQKRYSETEPGKQDKVSKSRRLQLEGFCHTLRAGTGSDYGSFQAVRPLHPTEHRVITPREAARLQGFPDWFQFDPTKWHSFRQIGSSVSPIIAEYILAVIRKSLIES